MHCCGIMLFFTPIVWIKRLSLLSFLSWAENLHVFFPLSGWWLEEGESLAKSVGLCGHWVAVVLAWLKLLTFNVLYAGAWSLALNILPQMLKAITRIQPYQSERVMSMLVVVLCTWCPTFRLRSNGSAPEVHKDMTLNQTVTRFK